MNNPLRAYYGISQGRIKPNYHAPLDGEYSFILGDEDMKEFKLSTSGYVEITQDLDLTSINVFRVYARIDQPDLPNPRLLTDPILSKAEIIPTDAVAGRWIEGYEGYARSETQLKAPFFVNTTTDKYLRIEVDKGSAQDITFSDLLPTAGFTAEEIRDTINAQLTGGTAHVTGASDDPTVSVRTNTQGVAGSIEILDYPTADDDANKHLKFFQKTARLLATDTAIFGRDNLYAIIDAGSSFTSVDQGQIVDVDGATNSSNNALNELLFILDESTAILRNEIIPEGAGFTAEVNAPRWKTSILIDSVEAFSHTGTPGQVIKTLDTGVNVSKITGVHTVTLKLSLLSLGV